MNHPKEQHMYGLFDEGYLVYKGTRHQICNEFHVNDRSFYEFLKRGMRIKKKYLVQAINGDEPLQEKPKPIIKSKEEEEFEYLFTMLKIHGNTSSSFDPHPYLRKLKRNGLKVDVRDSVFGGYYLEVQG